MKNKKSRLWILVAASLVIFFIIRLILDGQCAKKDDSICVINAGKYKIKAKVAYSRQAQAKGLMGVTVLNEGEGMIFVYDSPQRLSFWMKNTLIPLDIAFVEADGRIAIIYDMKTEVGKPDFILPTYASPTAVKYAIEVPKGWFTSSGIKTSDYVNIPRGLQ